MQVLFEGHPYERGLLCELVGADCTEPSGAALATTSWVGYVMPQPGTVAFILPKVFLSTDAQGCSRFLEGPTPEQLLQPDAQTRLWLQQQGHERLLSDLSLALYQAIRRYQRRTCQHGAQVRPLPLIRTVSSDDGASLLELFASLASFWRRNHALCSWVTRIGSGGGSVAWRQTMAAQLPLPTAQGPLYPAPLRRRQHGQDDELMVMLRSVLHYLAAEYGLHTGGGSELQPRLHPAEFRRLLQGRGLRRLRSIRGRYYREVMRELWELLYAFFSHRRTRTQTEAHAESLLCSNFQLVFEDMIEALLGGEEQRIPRHFRRQRDGRIVDHLFRSTGVLGPADTYYIADSKYYRPDREVSGEALEKQYAYAKNIIQYQIDDVIGPRPDPVRSHGIFCRDRLTEAYNVIPNVLIRGTAAGGTGSTAWLQLCARPQRRLQFANRLFDRDTLYVLTLEISFVFVLMAYVRPSACLQRRLRRAARSRLRQACIDVLNADYAFYHLACDLEGGELQAFVREHFWELHGKVCRAETVQGQQCRGGLILALDRSCRKENARLLDKFAQVLGPSFTLA